MSISTPTQRWSSCARIGTRSERREGQRWIDGRSRRSPIAAVTEEPSRRHESLNRLRRSAPELREMPLTSPDAQAASDRLIVLTHELIDAHCDTVCLAGDGPGSPRWAAHLEYLKALQRVGQRTLAELA